MKLDRKQKVLITLIIIALAFLAWQLYDMFFANDEQATAPQTTTLQPISPAVPAGHPPSTLQPISAPPTQPSIPAITPLQPPTTSAPQMVPVRPTPPAAQLQPTPAQTAPTPVTVTTTVTTPTLLPVTLPSSAPVAPAPQPQIRQMTLSVPITATQAEYLRLVNRYQIVRMKRLVTDEEAAIAQSQEKIAQLNQQISKIGGQTPSNAITSLAAVSITGYQLMYLDNQGGQWTATLSKAGRFNEVTPGMILGDGTRVMRINENGVVILQNGNYYLLNFYGTTRLARFSAPPPKRMAPPKPMPQPVIIQPVRKKILERRMMPTRCVANSSDPSCAPKTLAALQPTVISHPATLPSLVSSLTAVAAPMQPPKNIPLTAMPTAQNPPPQPSPFLQPQPPATLPLKTKHDLLALTPQQKNKVMQIETTTPTKPAVFNIDSYSTDEKHLLAAPADYYTLQLIGNNNLSTLTDFIRAHKFTTNVYTYHTFYLNKDWFVLIYGIFKTQQEALNAIKELPPAAQQLKPWVRTLTSVQEAIKLAPANR